MEYCIETNIAYYEYLIEMERTNQQIHEELFMNKSIDESAVNEAVNKYVNAAIEFIKKLLTNLVDFVGRMWKTFTKMKNTHLKVNMKLVKACDDKIKSMSAEDQRTFNIPKVLYSNSLAEFVTFMNTNNATVGATLGKLMDDLSTYTHDGIFPKDIQSTIQNIQEIDKEYDKLSNPINLKKDMVDVSFDNIMQILDDYKNSPNSINLTSIALKTTEDTAKLCKKKISDIIDQQKDKKDLNLDEFKTAIFASSNLVIKICKGIIDIAVEMFRSYERILNAFVNWKSNTESFYFEEEDKLYLL